MKIQLEKASESYIVGVLLAVAGGFLDVYTYISRGGVFANAQTGNIVLLGISAADGNWKQIMSYVWPILAFMAGILLTEAVRKKYRYNPGLHWRQIVIGLEFLVLLCIAFVPSGRLNDLVNVLVSFAVLYCGSCRGHSPDEAASGAGGAGSLRHSPGGVCDYVCAAGGSGTLRKNISPAGRNVCLCQLGTGQERRKMAKHKETASEGAALSKKHGRTREKDIKTNAMRILEQKKIPYTVHTYDCEEFMDGVTMADALGQPHELVYKTLVTVAKSKEHYVFVIPIEAELDLKKAARAVHEKSIEMLPLKELTDLTGYVRGGCTCIGMKKQFPVVMDESARSLPKVMVSGGRRGSQMELSPEDLMRAAGGSFADVTAE